MINEQCQTEEQILPMVREEGGLKHQLEEIHEDKDKVILDIVPIHTEEQDNLLEETAIQ